MSFKDVIVYVDGTDASKARDGLAINLAKTQGAHLVAVAFAPQALVPLYGADVAFADMSGVLDGVKAQARLAMERGVHLDFRRGTFRYEANVVVDEVARRLSEPPFDELLPGGIDSAAGEGIEVVTTLDVGAQRSAVGAPAERAPWRPVAAGLAQRALRARARCASHRRRRLRGADRAFSRKRGRRPEVISRRRIREVCARARPC